MTATCREPCCAKPRMTVGELLERGLRRNRAAPLAIEGDACGDAEGNRARFSVATSGGKVAAVGFRATSCATLIAYGEWIAETAPGLRLELAAGLSARNLVDALPGVPALKRERAVLAVAAFRSALAKASNDEERP
jgi:NifU-like protein involved in Fe-S cluster formation